MCRAASGGGESAICYEWLHTWDGLASVIGLLDVSEALEDRQLGPFVPDSIVDMRYTVVWKPLRRSLGIGTVFGISMSQRYENNRLRKGRHVSRERHD